MGNYERQDLIDDIAAALKTADEERLLEIHRKLYNKIDSDITKAFKRFDDATLERANDARRYFERKKGKGES